MVYTLADFAENPEAQKALADSVFGSIEGKVDSKLVAAFSQVTLNLITFGAPWELYTPQSFKALDKPTAKALIEYSGGNESVYKEACEKGFVLHVNPNDISKISALIQGAPLVKVDAFQYDNTHGKVIKTGTYDTPLFSSQFLQCVYSKGTSSYYKLQDDVQKARLFQAGQSPKQPDILKGNGKVALLSLNNDTWVALPNAGKIPAYSLSFEQFQQVSGITPKPIEIGPKSRSFIVAI